MVVVESRQDGVCEYWLEWAVWASVERMVRMWTQGTRERVEVTRRRFLGGESSNVKGHVQVMVLMIESHVFQAMMKLCLKRELWTGTQDRRWGDEYVSPGQKATLATNSPLSDPQSVEALTVSLSGSQSLRCMFFVVQMSVYLCHVHVVGDYATAIWLLYKDIDRMNKFINH